MRLVPRIEKISHPNPVVTWDTAGHMPHARGLLVDELTGIAVSKSPGRCGLASCGMWGDEEVAQGLILCAPHAEQFQAYRAAGRPALHPEAPTWY